MHSIASQENPMYWLARDFSVYMINGAWFYCRLNETGAYAGWHRASHDFIRDVKQAYEFSELLPSRD